ncbi:hypothetical protein [Thermus tenuipuniceus]|uniref:hypothetical protein n=1 Tax=Thermus tenuipuniceus TaxID=2078690 RepID=UPI000CFA1FA4|nr:hypothetical protein [Thermus tenuipuniceus]
MRRTLFALGLALGLSLAQGLLLESDLVQVLEVPPGGEARGVVRLRNGGQTPLAVSLSLEDYREGQGFLPLGQAPRSLGPEGVRLEATRLLLAPGEAREVGFTVRAPQGLEGTRYVALLLTPEGQGGGQGGGEAARVGLQLVQRYAVLILASHGGEAQIAFTGARFQEGRLFLEAENRGNRYYYPQARYQVVGSGGVVAEGALGTFLFLPGGPKRFPVPLPSLAPGEYQVVVFLDDGAKAYAVRTRLSVR